MQLHLIVLKASMMLKCLSFKMTLISNFVFRVYPGQGKCDKLFAKMNCLKSEDIADSVLYILALPPHANVDDIIIRPTEQAE